MHGIAAARHFTFKYWPYEKKLGREPEILTSLRCIEGLARPNHFSYMFQNIEQ